MESKKRKIDIVIISDVHLGTYGCRAIELLTYLKSIKPKIIVLNGDIIDIWQFNKRYWPKSHMKVVRYLMGMISKGVKTYYIPGNHDEMLRKFAGFKIGSFEIVNKIVLELDDDKKAWIFHGDIFDVTMQHSKWLAKLGAIGYDSLIIINAIANFISEKLLGRGKLSFANKIKKSVKSAVKFVNRFEETCADIGIMNNYDYVICGHIHQPEMKEFSTDKGTIRYLNSGDWVENRSTLEYAGGKWSLYHYNSSEHDSTDKESDLDGTAHVDLSNEQLFRNLLEEFNRMKG